MAGKIKIDGIDKIIIKRLVEDAKVLQQRGNLHMLALFIIIFASISLVKFLFNKKLTNIDP